MVSQVFRKRETDKSNLYFALVVLLIAGMCVLIASSAFAEKTNAKEVTCVVKEYGPRALYLVGPRIGIDISVTFKETDIDKIYSEFFTAIANGKLDDFIEAHGGKEAQEKAMKEYEQTLVSKYRYPEWLQGFIYGYGLTNDAIELVCPVTDDDGTKGKIHAGVKLWSTVDEWVK